MVQGRKVIDYVMVGTNGFDEAVSFYEVLMTAKGATRVDATDRNLVWGWGLGKSMFIVTTPYDSRPAAVGNGGIVAFICHEQTRSTGSL
jgi:hypothetical protein